MYPLMPASKDCEEDNPTPMDRKMAGYTWGVIIATVVVSCLGMPTILDKYASWQAVFRLLEKLVDQH